MSRLLAEVTRMAQQGRISEAMSSLRRDLEKEGDSYGILSNLAALHLQLGEVQRSIELNSKAISLDPFAYVAYYNRFLSYFVQQKLRLAWGDLQKALSCLYLLKGYEENNLKYLNKAINYCEQNARAYLVRAKCNEGKNNKLAENDYSIAIEYAPNLREIYQQRALFYRKIGRAREFEENYANYLSLKALGAKHTAELIQNQSNDVLNYRDRIGEGAREFQELLSRSKSRDQIAISSEEIISKLPLDSVQSRIDRKDDEELLLSDRPDEVDTAKTIEIRKEEINFRKRAYEDRLNKNFDEIFQDENSKELNDEIEKLEKEIAAEGGKLSLEDNEQLDVSDPSNFLTVEIEKAIEEITKLSNRDTINDVKSVKSANSNASVGSKDQKEISADEFKRYRKFQLEILSLQDLDNQSRRQTSKVVLRYKDQEYETSMGKFEWGQKLIIPIEFDVYEVEVEAIQKGGVFKASTSLGEGTIYLLEQNQSKCILGSKGKKTAILYYKLKLI